jgi:glycine cleavage system H protein
MSKLPENLKYAKTHEWSKIENDNIVRIGITDFAQEELGDLVYIELPKIGQQVKAGEQCAVVESVKTASDLFSSTTGVITSINEAVIDTPEKVNDHPYKSWLFCIKANDISELEQLMDASSYQKMIDE